MKKIFYRVVCDGVGIYEAVNKNCSPDDRRRSSKPDGSWLAKIGLKYPDGVSFWTEKGYKSYQESKLCDWHLSVTQGKHKVLYAQNPKNILYKDEHQIILKKDDIDVFDEKVIEKIGRVIWEK
jgi:hypothetical protein